MCGCGCELGLVLAVCRAGDTQHPAVQGADVALAQGSRSIVERLTMFWLARLFGDGPLSGQSRGSGK